MQGHGGADQKAPAKPLCSQRDQRPGFVRPAKTEMPRLHCVSKAARGLFVRLRFVGELTQRPWRGYSRALKVPRDAPAVPPLKLEEAWHHFHPTR